MRRNMEIMSCAAMLVPMPLLMYSHVVSNASSFMSGSTCTWPVDSY
jgi:hypothetical protein